MIRQILPPRGWDSLGGGHFKAPRNYDGRKGFHNGVDETVLMGSGICSIMKGRVTKLGYPYDDDLSYRYVEVTDDKGLRHRIFYIDFSVKVGDIVTTDDVIGTPQDIRKRYPSHKINPHLHYEIKKPDGSFIDPVAFHKARNAK